MAARREHRRAFGSVRLLSSGRYQARYKGPDGIERAASRRFDTKTDAGRWLATQQADIVRDTWRAPERGDEQLMHYLAAWLDARVDLAPRTLALYRRLARVALLAQLEPRVNLGTLPLRRITPTIVREWYAAVTRVSQASASTPPAPPSQAVAVRTWARARGLSVADTGRLSPALVEAWREAGCRFPKVPKPSPTAGRTQAAQAYRLLRTVLGSAVRDGLIEVNPCHIEKAGTLRNRERVPATPAEVELLAAAVPARYAAAVTVAAWSGLRAGELFALRRKDVDSHAGTVRVERSLIDISGQPLAFGPTKSDAGKRVVNLPRTVAAALAAHLDEHTGPEPDALVFATRTGTPLRGSSRSKMFNRARAKVGRPDLRWHDLRHTGATLAAATGASLAELQRRFGHSTISAAMIYQHASNTQDRLLADRLDLLASPTSNVVPITKDRTG